VPQRPLVELGHQRERQRAVVAQRRDDGALVDPAEREVVDGRQGRDLIQLLVSGAGGRIEDRTAPVRA
jgi:hypothetical protein